MMKVGGYVSFRRPAGEKKKKKSVPAELQQGIQQIIMKMARKMGTGRWNSEGRFNVFEN